LYWCPADRDSYVRRLDSEGEVRNVEYLLRRKDGSMLVIVDNGRVVRDREGRISGFEGTIADITERKRAEPRLPGEGARTGHAPVHRRRGHHHRFRRAHRLHESGG